MVTSHATDFFRDFFPMAYRFLSCSTRSTALIKLLVQKPHFFKGGGGVGRRGSVNIK